MGKLVDGGDMRVFDSLKKCWLAISLVYLFLTLYLAYQECLFIIELLVVLKKLNWICKRKVGFIYFHPPLALPARSLWKFPKNVINRSLFFWRMSMMALGLLGLATNTLNTWNASNWIFRLLCRSKFIMSFRFSGSEMYLVIMLKLLLSRRSSPSN